MAKVIYIFGNDISTDIIYPGRYMATVLPSETPQYAFADIPELNKLLKEKSATENLAIVAGDNFGCGSSREQAASCLKGHNLIVIAKNFARIFLQNAINLGLKVIICPELEVNINDNIEISGDKIINLSTGKSFSIIPLPKNRQDIIDAGGLIPYTRKKMLEERVK